MRKTNDTMTVKKYNVSGCAALLLAFAALVSGCTREPVGGGIENGYAFSVAGNVGDLETKSVTSCTPLGNDLSLIMEEEPLVLGVPPTKVYAIYRKNDATPLGGAAIKVWAYNMAKNSTAVTAVSGWKLDPGSTSPVDAPYNSTSGLWVPSPAVAFNKAALDSTYRTRFFAVAPADAVGSSGGATFGTMADATLPTLTYQAPVKVDPDASGNGFVQRDLLVAMAPPRSIVDRTPVNLSFKHVLTGIRIKAEKGTPITSMKITGIYDSGKLDLTLPDSGAWWSDLQKKGQTYALDLSGSDIWDTASDAAYNFVKDRGVMMLIPQWLPKDAKIVVTIDGFDYEASISGHRWLPGKLVTYRVAQSKRDYHIELDSDLLIAPSAAASSVSTDLECWSEPNGGGLETDEEWEVAGIYSSMALAASGGTGDMPGWNASVNGKQLTIDIPAATVAETNTSQGFLSAAGTLGTPGSPFNLANPSTGRRDYIAETANTYIINGPGCYCFPLVVGNGVKRGIFNTVAFNPSNFADYRDNNITSPYLHQTKSGTGSTDYTPADAIIVWAESDCIRSLDGTAPSQQGGIYVINNAITRDTLRVPDIADEDDNIFWFNFSIPRADIKPGCAVVAVRDATGVVMWSWLLWITDYSPVADGDITCTYTSGNNTVDFMPRLLGWTEVGNITAYPQKWGYVRVQPKDSPGDYVILSVVRPAGKTTSSPVDGHAPYFQSGRSVAMLPSADISYRENTNLTPAVSSFNVPVACSTRQTLGNIIRHPEYFMTVLDGNTSEDAMDILMENTVGGTTYYNWWCAGMTEATHNTDIKTVKTIYDPSPAGYTIPRKGAFDGIDAGSSAWYDYGLRANTGYKSSGLQTLSIPAIGLRSTDSAPSTNLTSVGVQGRVWVTTCQNGTRKGRMGYRFRFQYSSSGTNNLNTSGTNFGTVNTNRKHWGIGVLPAREEK